MNNTINIAVVGLGQVGSYLFNELNINQFNKLWQKAKLK